MAILGPFKFWNVLHGDINLTWENLIHNLKKDVQN